MKFSTPFYGLNITETSWLLVIQVTWSKTTLRGYESAIKRKGKKAKWSWRKDYESFPHFTALSNSKMTCYLPVLSPIKHFLVPFPRETPGSCVKCISVTGSFLTHIITFNLDVLNIPTDTVISFTWDFFSSETNL